MEAYPLLLTGLVAILLVAPAGCGTQEPRAVDNRPVAASESGASLVHPPYIDGEGELNGTFVSSATATYPAGSVQKPVAFTAIIVEWSEEGDTERSEFLVNGYADLVVDGVDEQTVEAHRILEALDSAGAGTDIQVAYEGSDLAPTWYSTPPDDFPYAVVTTLTIGP